MGACRFLHWLPPDDVNQKSKYAYRKIFFYKKSTGLGWTATLHRSYVLVCGAGWIVRTAQVSASATLSAEPCSHITTWTAAAVRDWPCGQYVCPVVRIVTIQTSPARLADQPGQTFAPPPCARTFVFLGNRRRRQSSLAIRVIHRLTVT